MIARLFARVRRIFRRKPRHALLPHPEYLALHIAQTTNTAGQR